MKKVLQMEDLDCAHCAEKMEKKISKIKGVESVSISFMAQKMVLECAEEDFERILEEARKAVASVDKECSIKGSGGAVL